MNTPNHPLRLLGMALIAFASTHALAQCDDALACNFDANSEGTDGCVYFDTDNFLLSENDFIGFLNRFIYWMILEMFKLR